MASKIIHVDGDALAFAVTGTTASCVIDPPTLADLQAAGVYDGSGIKTVRRTSLKALNYVGVPLTEALYATADPALKGRTQGSDFGTYNGVVQ